MPTYQYTCTACAQPLEAVQSFTDAPLAECPACGGALRKVFSAVGVVFKGSGFYKNDSRKPEGSSSGGEKKADAGTGDKAAAAATSTGAKDSPSATPSTPAPAASPKPAPAPAA